VTAAHPTTAGERPCRVVFLIQRAESWINVHGLWRLMCRDERFVADVRVIPYDDDAERLTQKRRACIDHLHSVGVSIVEEPSGSPAPLEPGEFDVAIFNAPYDRERIATFHFDRVAASVALTVYVPYGMVMGSGRRNRHYQYAQPTQRDANLIVARSEMEREMYARYCPSGADHVAVTGLPRLDELHDIESFKADPELRNAVAGRFAVLWNAHFSFGLSYAADARYSTFDVLAKPLFELAAAKPDIALIWRPHPSLFRTLVDDGILSPKELDTFREEVRGAGVILDERSDHRHAFAVSNMLLTDLGSFLVEYLATSKPLVYLHASDGEGLNEEGASLASYIDTARTAPDAIELINVYAGGADPRSLSRRLARERFLPMFDGHAADRVADRILASLCAADNAHTATPLLRKVFESLAQIGETRRHRRLHWPTLRRLTRLLRLEVAEWIKRHPMLLRMTQQVGHHLKSMRKPPRA